MVVKTFNLTYSCGLHARPCTTLAKILKNFDAKVTINDQVDAGSVLQVLSLGVQPGLVAFKAEGKDEEVVMEAIADFIDKLNKEKNI